MTKVQLFFSPNMISPVRKYLTETLRALILSLLNNNMLLLTAFVFSGSCKCNIYGRKHLFKWVKGNVITFT